MRWPRADRRPVTAHRPSASLKLQTTTDSAIRRIVCKSVPHQRSTSCATPIQPTISIALTDSASARLKILQNSAKAQESLRENMTTSAEAAKSRAARKLEEAKQQLEMLKSGGYPPEVVARLAAELAHKISAAAAEFASAVATSATSAPRIGQCSRCNRRCGHGCGYGGRNRYIRDSIHRKMPRAARHKRTSPTAQPRHAMPTRASSKMESRHLPVSRPRIARRWKSSRPSCRKSGN